MPFSLCGIIFCISLLAMEQNEPRELSDIVARYVITHPALLTAAENLNADMQALLSQKLLSERIKPALFPIKFNTPENPRSIDHHGVCGLETISKANQIISISCDGQIAICDETAMDKCKVVNTRTSWYCACLKCEPTTLCLGGLSGNVGYMGINDKAPERIFKAHDQTINGLSLSSNQQHLISCSNDWKVKLWDTADNRRLAEFIGHTKAVKSAFSIKSDQKVVSGGADQTLRIWDIGTAKEEQHYSLQETIFQGVSFFCLARHPHEQVTISGLNNGMVALYDIRKNRHVACLRKHAALVSALVCSDEGHYVASASWDEDVRLWDLRMLGCSAILAYHKDWVQSIASLRNFQKIISGSRTGEVKLWNVSSVLAVDQMNNLKETAAKAALVAAEKPFSNDKRLAMLQRITEQSQAQS